ncbi:MAG: cullin-associated NEDD8-dissociated protein 1-like protein [Olpidium bornovanus]|uniref:Cullin-associated NEDD8-dissociated protein 1-like protein n=1 Tax=Olpidium bornovanus TaxID=278681 RepID=A0A8H7ZV71_9FUNG|nr:MAG: cullin-associated NEDD8-dissociated protein 1-like protein [Olpidium bornovanus]
MNPYAFTALLEKVSAPALSRSGAAEEEDKKRAFGGGSEARGNARSCAAWLGAGTYFGVTPARTAGMSNPDTDFRFMAANDLINELNSASASLDEQTQRRLVSAVLKLLDDKNGEVQNLAVNRVMWTAKNVSRNGLGSRLFALPPAHAPAPLPPFSALNVLVTSLGTMVKLLREAELYSVVDQLCDMTSEKKEGLRDIANIAVKTVIMEVQPGAQVSANLVQRLVPRLLGLLEKVTAFLPRMWAELERSQRKLSGVAYEVQMDALDTLSETLSRFGNVVSSAHQLQQQLQNALQLALTNSRPAIRKRATTAIVCLEYLQYDPNYDASGESEDEDMATSGEDEDAEDNDRTLSAIIGTRHEILAQLYREVSPALISRFKEREDSVRVSILQTYIVLLRMTNVYGGDSLDLDYSSTHSIQIDDGSRKRRRAQTNSMDTDDGYVGGQLPQLCRSLAKQLVGKSTATRQTGFTLLRELVSVLRGGLENYLDLLVPAIEASLSAGPASSIHQTGTNSNLRIETLIFLRALFWSHSPAALCGHLPKFCHLVSVAIGDKFYKITAEALLAAKNVVSANGSKSSAPMDPSLVPLAKEIFSATIAIASTADADQEVKERSITCLGTLIAHCGDMLSAELETCVPILLDRLRNEVTRLITVKAICFIANADVGQLQPVQGMMLEAVDEVAPLLRKTHRGLRVSSALCLEAIVRRYGRSIKPAQYSALITELQPLVSESDLHLLPLALDSIVAMIEANPNVLADVHSRILPSVFQLVQSPLIQGSALGSLLKLFTVMVRANEADFVKLRDELIQPVVSDGDKDQLVVSKQAYAAVAQCVAVLCINSPANRARMVESLARNVREPSLSNSVKYVTLMTLGELGRNLYVPGDLSQHATLYDDILDLLTVPLEEVKSASAFALGNIAVGNIPKYLPVIISEIKTQPKRQYLLLHALKEVITRKEARLEGRQELEAYVDEIWLLLFNNCDSTEEGTRNVVSECLGKLTLTNPFKFLPELTSRLKDSSAQTRATVITAIKYTFTDTGVDYDELLRPQRLGLYASEAAESSASGASTRDELTNLSPRLQNVRRLALSTLNSAAHNKPHLLYDLLRDLLPLLYNETIVKPELIRMVEMGPFKHKVDDGLEIRKVRDVTCLLYKSWS